MAGVDALIARGLADPARLFLYGWSYGGYLTNWAITHTDRFRAAASGAGVADLRMQYVISDARRWRFDYFSGSPFTGHQELYARESPITVRRPRPGCRRCSCTARQDVRVPPAQGWMMYRGLRDAGSRRRWSSIRAKGTASRSRGTSWTGCGGSRTGSPATTSPGAETARDRLSSRSLRGKERALVRENLKVARFYFVLLALFTVGRWAQSLGHVGYAKGHHVFSIVTLTFLSSAFFAAFCRKWRGYTLLQAVMLGMMLGLLAQVVIFASTAALLRAGPAHLLQPSDAR